MKKPKGTKRANKEGGAKKHGVTNKREAAPGDLQPDPTHQSRIRGGSITLPLYPKRPKRSE